MRKNFAQILSETGIDIKKEYSRLYKLFYDKNESGELLSDIISQCFLSYHFRGTCLSLDDFNETHNFDFKEFPSDFDINYLITFCEYFYNFVIYFSGVLPACFINSHFYIDQIHRVIESLGYKSFVKNDLTLFVPKNSIAIAVAESGFIPNDFSYKIIEYNHHSLDGDIKNKKNILLKLADLLEPKEPKLKEINKQFSSDLFFLFNSCQIRHNNKNTESKYKEYIAQISDEGLEHIYDEIYQMCLFAFMQLEHAEKKVWLKDLKDKLSNKI